MGVRYDDTGGGGSTSTPTQQDYMDAVAAGEAEWGLEGFLAWSKKQQAAQSNAGLELYASLLALNPGSQVVAPNLIMLPNGRIVPIVVKDGKPALGEMWTEKASSDWAEANGLPSGPGGTGGSGGSTARLQSDDPRYWANLDRDFAENQRQFDLTRAEDRRQFDLDYNRGIMNDGAAIGIDYAKLNQQEQDAVRQLTYQYYNSTQDANSARRQALATLIAAKQNGAIDLAQASGQIAAQAAQFAANPRDAVADIMYRTAIGGATPHGSTANPAFGEYQTALDNKFQELFGGVGQDLANARQYLQQPIPQEYLTPIQMPQVPQAQRYLPPALNMPLAQYADNPNPTARALLSLNALGVNSYTPEQRAALTEINNQGQAPAPQPQADPWAALRGYTPEQNQELIRYAQAMQGHSDGTDQLMLRNPIVAIDTVTKQPVFTIAENGKELIKETKKGIKVVPQKGVSQKLDPRKQAAMVKQLYMPGYADGGDLGSFLNTVRNATPAQTRALRAIARTNRQMGRISMGRNSSPRHQEMARDNMRLFLQLANEGALHDPSRRSAYANSLVAAHDAVQPQNARARARNEAAWAARNAGISMTVPAGATRAGLNPWSVAGAGLPVPKQQSVNPVVNKTPEPQVSNGDPRALPVGPGLLPPDSAYDLSGTQTAQVDPLGASFGKKKQTPIGYGKAQGGFAAGGYLPSSSEGGTNMNIHEPFRVVGDSGHVYAVGGEDRPMQLHIKGIPSIEKAKKEQEKKAQEKMKGFASGTAPGEDLITGIRNLLRSYDPQIQAQPGQDLPDLRLLSGIYSRLLADKDAGDYVRSGYSKYGISDNDFDYTLRQFQPQGLGYAPTVRYA